VNVPVITPVFVWLKNEFGPAVRSSVNTALVNVRAPVAGIVVAAALAVTSNAPAIAANNENRINPSLVVSDAIIRRALRGRKP
jgi:uncharacterized membrane protein YfbV (UPF0208 family)